MTVDLSDVNAVIEKNMAAFDKPGVLSVRPGFKVTKDWLTNTKSIVVTVRRKVAHLPQGEMLPAEVGGVPVDVRQASPEKALELEDPQKYAAGLRLAPDLGSVPHFADERTLAGSRPRAAASPHAQLAAIAKPELTYGGPHGVTLDPVEAQATITLSASPDSGWPTLRAFLAGTAETLTVGLYDFTSAHVARTVTDSLAGRKLSLVLDHPAKNPTADQTDPATVSQLRQAVAGGFTQAWALTRTDPDATAWIFPSAYHIKVAVRYARRSGCPAGTGTTPTSPTSTRSPSRRTRSRRGTATGTGTWSSSNRSWPASSRTTSGTTCRSRPATTRRRRRQASRCCRRLSAAARPRPSASSSPPPPSPGPSRSPRC